MDSVQRMTTAQVHVPAQPIGLFLMINTLEMGGSERQFATLARSLDSQPFQLHLGCIRRHGSMAAEFAEIPEFRLGGSLYGFKSIASRFRLSRHLRRHAVQVAHAFDFYTNLTLIPAALFARTPIVIGSHRQVGDLLTGRQFRAQAAAFRACHAVVCNSHAAASRLAAAGLSQNKLVVIGNAISGAAFQISSPVLPRRASCLRVCMVSRMNARYKNHRGFLRIAAQICRQMPGTEFVLVGDGPLRPELEQAALDYGIGDAVTFLGERQDIPAVLASMDVAVLTSDSESLSNAILEAMAARLPVVAYDVGGNSELINSQRGVLVRAGDENGFSASVQRLLADSSLRQILGTNASHFVADNFSLEKIRRRYHDLYLDLLDRKGRSQPVA